MIYRNICVKLMPKDNEASRDFLLFADREEVLPIHQIMVLKDVMVQDLSDTAMEEFVRKYIDVHYDQLAAEVDQPAPIPQIPLFQAALDVALQVQKAADWIVKRCLETPGGKLNVDADEIEDTLGIDHDTIMCLIDNIADAAWEHEEINYLDRHGTEIDVECCPEFCAAQTSTAPQLEM